MNNGSGIRATLWLPGCSHNCPGCHNAWTADYNQGKEFGKNELNELIEFLNKDYVAGLTLSGGDPLDQSDEVLNELYALIYLLRNSVKRDFDVWIYSGYYKEELTREAQLKVLSICDILVDGPFILEQRNITLPFRGSNNQRIWGLHINEIIPDIEFQV